MGPGFSPGSAPAHPPSNSGRIRAVPGVVAAGCGQLPPMLYAGRHHETKAVPVGDPVGPWLWSRK